MNDYLYDIGTKFVDEDMELEYEVLGVSPTIGVYGEDIDIVEEEEYWYFIKMESETTTQIGYDIIRESYLRDYCEQI